MTCNLKKNNPQQIWDISRKFSKVGVKIFWNQIVPCHGCCSTS